MKIKFTFKETTFTELKLGKLNVFYGASNSGKSLLMKEFAEGFSGKSGVKFHVDNLTLSKTEYDVVFFDHYASFAEQLKMNSKSLLKKIIFEDLISNMEKENDEQQSFFCSINKMFENIKTNSRNLFDYFNSILIDCNLKLNLELKNLEDLLPIIISFLINDKEEISLSHSASKQLLLCLLFYYVKTNNHPKIIILDNFDAELDEALIIYYLNQIKQIISENNCYFILTTNRPESFMHIFDSSKIFCLKNNKVKNLSNIELFIKKSILENSDERLNSTFEEFLLNTHMFISEEHLKDLKAKIKISIPYNLSKMLVNNEYIISDEIIEQKICIIPNSKLEKLFLLEINRYLQN